MIDPARLDKHERIGCFYSGGKDSLACVLLLKEHWDRITIYHADTGDTLPEMREAVAAIECQVPNFVRIEVDVAGWIARHGIPTDLLPHSAHPIGWLMHEHKAKLQPRYNCCFANLMLPLWRRAKADLCTMVVRGTKRADMNHLPAGDGDIAEGIELYYPVQEWTDDQVLAFLACKGVKLPRVYDYLDHGLDCARCSAWWSEGRGAYLKRFHPALWRDYDARLQVIIDELAPSLALLRREAGVD
jgi:phosphoadenosine phosphosulfate reductase